MENMCRTALNLCKKMEKKEKNNNSLRFLVNATWKKQQILISYSSVRPDRASNPRSTAVDASTLTITPPMRFTSSPSGITILHRSCFHLTTYRLTLSFATLIRTLNISNFTSIIQQRLVWIEMHTKQFILINSE